MNWLSIERFNVLWGRRNFDALGKAELTLEASSPGVDVGFVSQNKRMGFAASDFDDSLVSEWLKDHWRKYFFGSSMTCSTKSASSVAEYVTVSGEVQGVISTAANLLEMTHFLSSLCLILHHVLLCLELLSLNFLTHSIHLLLLVLDREHLLRLFVWHSLLILLLVDEPLGVIVDCVHVAVNSILVRSFLEGGSVLIFTHVVVSLTESV